MSSPQEEDKESLSTIEAHLERVVSNAPLILWSIDRAGIIRFVRGSSLAALNVTPEDLLGRSVYDTFPDLPEAIRFYERALSGERLTHVIAARGRTIENHYFPVPDASGAIVGVNGMAIDVTDRVQAQSRLSLVTSALEQTADHVFITDREGQIQFANLAFEHQTGYPASEVLGQAPRMLKSNAHPLEFYREIWERILSGEPWRGIVINRRKDGTLYDEEKTITPMRDASGTITHFVSVGRDITERRKLEQKEAQLQAEVAQSARQWRATFDAVDSAIVILYRDLRVRRLNRAARDIAGKPFGAVKGLLVGEIGDAPLWRAFSEAASQALAKQAPVSLHVHDEAAGNTWDVSASPLADGADGDVILLARDVSRIVELQESLRRNETLSAIGQVVAGVAHEVRNPLFGIAAMLDAFEVRFKDRPEYQEHSERLRLQVERLTELMQDLLDYGRPNPPRLERGSLPRVIQEAATACAGSARKAGANLVTDVAKDLPDVYADEARLVQVYRNLIDNALQHSSAGSEVRISARLDSDGLVESCVTDSGPGFSEADLPRLFEPFFTRRAGGTGLGLSIVERIVSAHGGRVLAQNRPEGGASVRVWLPLALG